MFQVSNNLQLLLLEDLPHTLMNLPKLLLAMKFYLNLYIPYLNKTDFTKKQLPTFLDLLLNILPILLKQL
jgi:hypothetical protein